MRKLYEHLHKDKRGFTLVELLIVVIILAVLAGIAIPSYMVLTNRARRTGTANEMRNIATALELYNADNRSYPEAIDEGQLAGYLENVPTTDAWGEDYVYTHTDGTYTLTSSGGDEDIVMQNGSFTAGFED